MRFLSVLVTFILISPVSQAASVRFDFTATATSVTTFPFTLPSIQVGDELSGSFILDLAEAATSSEETRINYDNSLLEINLSVAGYSIQLDVDPPFNVSGGIAVLNDPQFDLSVFIIDVFAQSNSIDGFSVAGVVFEFNDPTGEAFSDLQLPTELAQINTQSLGLSFVGNSLPALAEFEITSIQSTIVPLPAGMWLLFSSLAVLGWNRKRSLLP